MSADLGMSSVVPLSRIPKIVGVVQAGGQGSRMDVLTRERAKPALPFAGSYQLVDFALSNFGNSGIPDVWVSVRYEASSLDRHLAGGRPWDLDRTRGGYRRLVPEEGQASGSEATIVTVEVPLAQAKHKTVVDVGRDGVVQGLTDKPTAPPHGTIAAEIFVYDVPVLLRTLDAIRHERAQADAGLTEGIGDFPDHLLPRLVEGGKTHAYALTGFWRDLGRPSAYLAAHRRRTGLRRRGGSDRRGLGAHAPGAGRFRCTGLRLGRRRLVPGRRGRAGRGPPNPWPPSDSAVVLVGRESYVAKWVVLEPGARLEPGTTAS